MIGPFDLPSPECRHIRMMCSSWACVSSMLAVCNVRTLLSNMDIMAIFDVYFDEIFRNLGCNVWELQLGNLRNYDILSSAGSKINNSGKIFLGNFLRYFRDYFEI